MFVCCILTEVAALVQKGGLAPNSSSAPAPPLPTPSALNTSMLILRSRIDCVETPNILGCKARPVADTSCQLRKFRLMESSSATLQDISVHYRGGEIGQITLVVVIPPHAQDRLFLLHSPTAVVVKPRTKKCSISVTDGMLRILCEPQLTRRQF